MWFRRFFLSFFFFGLLLSSIVYAKTRDGTFAGNLDNLFVLTLPMSDDLDPNDPNVRISNTAILGSRYTGAGNFINTAEGVGIPLLDLRSIDEQQILTQAKSSTRFGGVLRQILQLALGLDTAQTNYVCIGSASIVEPINEGDIDTGSKGGVIVTRALVVRDVKTFSSNQFNVTLSASSTGGTSTPAPTQTATSPGSPQSTPTPDIVVNPEQCSTPVPNPSPTQVQKAPTAPITGSPKNLPTPSSSLTPVPTTATNANRQQNNTEPDTAKSPTAGTASPGATATNTHGSATVPTSSKAATPSSPTDATRPQISGSFAFSHSSGLVEYKQGRNLVLAVNLTK